VFAEATCKAPLFRGNMAVGVRFTLAADGKDLGVSDERPTKQSNGQTVQQLRFSAPCSMNVQQR
jgi:hypothetical protein